MKFKSILISVLSIFAIYNISIAQECELLAWSDEFDGDALNLNNWNYNLGNGCPNLCGWGNNEQQYYTNSEENVYVENGVLTIKAKNDTLGGMMFSSARITTKNKVDFRYGRIEASIRLPETQGLWPAFWMLPTEKVYGGWPKSGEIDIMELLGHQPDVAYGTVHTGLPYALSSQTYMLEDGVTFVDTFHTFALEWEMDTIRWFIDGNQYHQLTPESISPWAPFNESFHLVLNVAVGGNFPGFTDETTVLPQIMEVDWIRVYSQPKDFQISGKKPVKGASNLKYKTFDIAGANYNWTVPEGSSIVSGEGTNEITVDWGCNTGDIQLEVQTECDTVEIDYQVGEFEELAIDGADVVVQNEEGISFQIPELVGATYNWELPEGTTIVSGDGSNTINVDWGCQGGDVIVNITATCGTYSDTLEVNLESYEIFGFSFVPEGSTSESYSITEVSNATYSWIVPEGATLVSGQGTNRINVDFNDQGGLVQVEITNSCGTVTYNINVSINPTLIYCDFDGVDLDFGDFGGTEFEKVENPYKEGINLSQNVGKMRKEPGAVDWGGLFADLGGEMDMVENPFLYMKVYSENTGLIKFKIEDLTSGVQPVEIDVDLGTANEWNNLIWDFTGQPAETFDRIALFFDFGNVDTSYYYFDDILGVSSETSSVNELSVNQIEVYPNPSSGIINVELNNNFELNTNVTAQLINSSGQVVYSIVISPSSEQVRIRAENLTPGMYFLKLKSKNTNYIKPISIIGK